MVQKKTLVLEILWTPPLELALQQLVEERRLTQACQMQEQLEFLWTPELMLKC